MDYILIRQGSDYIDREVCLKGWVTHIRPSGKIIFIELRDGSGEIQCVVFKGYVSEETFETAKKLTIETSMAVYGVIRRDNRSKAGYELSTSVLEVIHQPEEEYPISPKEHGVAFLHENRHLWLRSTRQRSIQNIRSTIINSSREFLESHGFKCFDAPIFTPVACEGTTSLFRTEYFHSEAYLTQSGQLYNEAGAMAYGRVYSFGPTFRAEKSKTRRHLTEFWMVEPEAAFFDLEQAKDLAQNLVAFIILKIVDIHKSELETLERDISCLEKITTPFPSINYDDAICLLKNIKTPIEWGNDLGAEHETIISESFDQPVIIQNYPAACKAFYMKNDPERPETVLCFDMIAPEGYGEIIGGGQREDDYNTLLNKIKNHELDPEHFSWYLDLRKYGSVQHAGFGLGIERLVSWTCGLNHVRETIPFPRMMDRVKP